MKLIPVLTEKSLNLAREGKYTFWVDWKSNKDEIKNLVDKVFGVHTQKVRTINYKGGVRKNFKGTKIRIPNRKKAMVTLGKDEKIDLFEKKEK
jgi:large subunit ribosomal protein L23